jgi:hypothetical protein
MTKTDLPRPRFARMYQRAAVTADQRGATEHRRRLLAGLTGTVLELGAGHGLNFPHYPSTVTEVIAVEPEPTLRERAAEAAAGAPIPMRVVAGVADELRRERLRFSAARFHPAIPHILGLARRTQPLSAGGVLHIRRRAAL